MRAGIVCGTTEIPSHSRIRIRTAVLHYIIGYGYPLMYWVFSLTRDPQMSILLPEIYTKSTLAARFFLGNLYFLTRMIPRECLFMNIQNNMYSTRHSLISLRRRLETYYTYHKGVDPDFRVYTYNTTFQRRSHFEDTRINVQNRQRKRKGRSLAQNVLENREFLWRYDSKTPWQFLAMRSRKASQRPDAIRESQMREMEGVKSKLPTRKKKKKKKKKKKEEVDEYDKHKRNLKNSLGRNQNGLVFGLYVETPTPTTTTMTTTPLA
ncbi:hypothetical protein V1477_008405 [Vespula maculifrons]|uniref:Uncharacterized protein n=1 Tax=Vespula maculifrons TaxID=7453 RepID=A0ABD2CCX2_VESMC